MTGQKTLKIQDLQHERREGTTDIMFVSEAVFAKLEKKDPKRYKVLEQIKEKPETEASAKK